MILSLYRGLTELGAPLLSLYLNRRLARGKEDAARFPERLGQPGLPRPEGRLVWLHAASVGESLSVLPLIERLTAERGLSVLITTGTVTSARLMAERLPAGALHQYIPVDRHAYVARFLDHWRPDLALWAESELWPNMLAEARARRLPMVLIQGRMSAKSFRNWRRAPSFAAEMLSSFALCLGQTPEDAARLRDLGAREADCVGNLKHAAPPLPAEEGALAEVRRLLGGRPVWLAASTHDGEEALAARAHRRLAARHPGLLTVVVPRHPQRGPRIAEDLAAQGHAVALRSSGAAVEAGTEVYLADTLGELGLFYRAVKLVFVGKSLGASGGQNPLEPARLGCAVLFGPNMGNFAPAVKLLLDRGAACQVADEAALAEVLDRLLADPAQAAEMGERGREAGLAEAGALDALLARLSPWLDALEEKAVHAGT